MPPPIVAHAEPIALPPILSRSAPPEGTEDARAVEEIRVRDATIDDIERMDELTLEDFAGNLAEIEVPPGGPLSNEQMGGLVSNFLGALQAQ